MPILTITLYILRVLCTQNLINCSWMNASLKIILCFYRFQKLIGPYPWHAVDQKRFLRTTFKVFTSFLLILYIVFIQEYLQFGIFRFFSVNIRRSFSFKQKSALQERLNQHTQACFGRHCDPQFPQIYDDFHSRFWF